jgi:hypothetical protein
MFTTVDRHTVPMPSFLSSPRMRVKPNPVSRAIRRTSSRMFSAARGRPGLPSDFLMAGFLSLATQRAKVRGETMVMMSLSALPSRWSS